MSLGFITRFLTLCEVLRPLSYSSFMFLQPPFEIVP